MDVDDIQNIWGDFSRPQFNDASNNNSTLIIYPNRFEEYLAILPVLDVCDLFCYRMEGDCVIVHYVAHANTSQMLG